LLTSKGSAKRTRGPVSTIRVLNKFWANTDAFSNEGRRKYKQNNGTCPEGNS